MRKRKYLAKSFRKDSCCRHDLGGIFEHDGRAELIELARNGLVAHRLARRANALALLDQGMSCSDVGAALFLDDDTVRTWFRLCSEEGTEGLAGFGYEGRAGHLKARQRDQRKSWIAETLPRTTRHVGAWIEQEFGIVYQSRSGLVTLLHRLGMEHRKPQAVSKKLDVVKQKAFIEAYETLMNNHEGPPRDEAYYTHLYAQLDDPNFISSVAEFLRTRDISGFNPGQRPPDTAAKSELIALTQSADDDTLQELVSLWPVDVISASELSDRFRSSDLKQPALRHAMDRAGVHKLRKVRIRPQNYINTGLRPELLYTLRNHDLWSTRGPAELRAELGRISYPEKTKALETCDD